MLYLYKHKETQHTEGWCRQGKYGYVNYEKSQIISVLLVLSFISRGMVFAAESLYEVEESDLVTSGLTYISKTKITADGIVDIHALKMDLNNNNVSLSILRSLEGWGLKDSLTDMMADDERIVAGINSSFFNTKKNPSEIIGQEYNQDYAIIRNLPKPDANSPLSLVQTLSGELFLEIFGAEITLKTAGGQPINVYGLNKLDNLADINIFNQTAIQDTAYIDNLAKVYKVAVQDGKVLNTADPSTVLDVPENGYIISFGSEIATAYIPSFGIGTGVDIQINNNLNRDDLAMVITGGGSILKDGIIAEPKGLVVEPTKRHPRSAIGLTADGNYLIAMVVDGR